MPVEGSAEAAQKEGLAALVYHDRYAQTLTYRNGRVILCVGAAGANGSKMLGFNIDAAIYKIRNHFIS